MDYSKYREEIYEKTNELSELISGYWNAYSSFDTWQFWVSLLLFILPLALLFFTVDRERIFEIFFFGYTVHILWTYASVILEHYNLMNHTHFLLPALPYSLNITSSLLPVGFLLLYQYTTRHKKNFYLYTLLLSAIFAFGFATIEEWSGLIELRRGMNYFYIFLIDIAVVFISYWFTLFIKRVKDNHTKVKK
ncbi:hypothetical protein [Oceanobacillus alkalisoli]|uniref:hypothetical protein n=1 Tax=Oceanobacillus alkalisoli TaxID=2925113 RepID=UPI001EEF9223|nr:hypothetical protein [Oceanobacillus alkalisoli]MCF3944823.1 hypothetical protein [Oceanobacillus alkalisoli]MCG5104745.1 hypothetical protein [Oceanobacillus alkalisoli]